MDRNIFRGDSPCRCALHAVELSHHPDSRRSDHLDGQPDKPAPAGAAESQTAQAKGTASAQTNRAAQASAAGRRNSSSRAGRTRGTSAARTRDRGAALAAAAGRVVSRAVSKLSGTRTAGISASLQTDERAGQGHIACSIERKRSRGASDDQDIVRLSSSGCSGGRCGKNLAVQTGNAERDGGCSRGAAAVCIHT